MINVLIMITFDHFWSTNLCSNTAQRLIKVTSFAKILCHLFHFIMFCFICEHNNNATSLVSWSFPEKTHCNKNSTESQGTKYIGFGSLKVRFPKHSPCRSLHCHQRSPISCNLPFLIAFLFLTCMRKRFVLWILLSCGDWDNKRIRNLGYIMSHLNSYYSVLCWHSIMHTSVSYFQSCRHGIWTSRAHPHNFSWKGKFLALGGGGPSFLFQFG